MKNEQLIGGVDQKWDKFFLKVSSILVQIQKKLQT